MNAFPSAREQYANMNRSNDPYSRIDEYLKAFPPINKDGLLVIKLTKALSTILCGYSLDDVNPERKEEILSTILGAMHSYSNQDEDPEYYYEVKYTIDRIVDGVPSMSLILAASKRY